MRAGPRQDSQTRGAWHRLTVTGRLDCGQRRSPRLQYTATNQSTLVIAGTAFHQESRLGMDGMKAFAVCDSTDRRCCERVRGWVDGWMGVYTCAARGCVCVRRRGEGTGEAEQIRRILAATDLIEELVRERLQRNARQCVHRKPAADTATGPSGRRTACSVQHTARSMQRATYHGEHANHTACSMQRTTLVLGCGRRHRTGAGGREQRRDANSATAVAGEGVPVQP